jgi:hypothetical protein
MTKTEKSKPSILSGIITAIVSTLLCLTLLELGARLITRNVPDDFGDIRDPDAPAYQNASYVNDTFMTEIPSTSQYVQLEGTDIYLHQDVDGEYINVVNNHRVTVDQPENYKHTIYVFGGTVVFGGEVPDAHTIPSYLQALTNEAYGDTYRVVNMGVNDMQTEQQMQYLKETPLEEGDIVIFLDGFNNATTIFSPAYDPTTVPWVDNRRVGTLGSLFRKTINTLGQHSKFVYHVLGFHNFRPNFLNDPELVEQVKNNMEEFVLPLYIESNDFAESQNAQFVQFFQPCIFNLPAYTPQEATIVSIRPLIPAGWGEAIQIGYTVNQNIGKALTDKGILNFDLSSALNPEFRPTPETDVYLDYLHMNHIGNQIIAEQIFEKIKAFLE